MVLAHPETKTKPRFARNQNQITHFPRNQNQIMAETWLFARNQNQKMWLRQKPKPNHYFPRNQNQQNQQNLLPPLRTPQVQALIRCAIGGNRCLLGIFYFPFDLHSSAGPGRWDSSSRGRGPFFGIWKVGATYFYVRQPQIKVVKRADACVQEHSATIVRHAEQDQNCDFN